MVTKWFLIKCLFQRTSFNKVLKKLTNEELKEHYNKAISKESYELAAYLKYYIELKNSKSKL